MLLVSNLLRAEQQSRGELATSYLDMAREDYQKLVKYGLADAKTEAMLSATQKIVKSRSQANKRESLEAGVA